MRKLKLFGIILVSLIGLIVVAAVAFVAFLPKERIIALATDQVREATGRELTLGPDVSPSFWPVLGVETGALSLSNADWASDPVMISANGAEIGVDIMALLGGDVAISTLRLVDPVVNLERDAEGRANWEFPAKDGAAAVEGQGADPGAGANDAARDVPRISLPEAVISNGMLSFRDAATGQVIRVEALDLTASLESLDLPLQAEGNARWNGEEVTFSLRAATPAGLLAGETTEIALALNATPVVAGFDGTVTVAQDGSLPIVSGQLQADIPNPSQAHLWALGLEAPPALGDMGAVTLEANVQAAPEALSLNATGGAAYKGRQVSFSLTGAAPDGWAASPGGTVKLSAQSSELFKITFEGPVSVAPSIAAEGPLSVEVQDIRGLAEWASGQPLTAPAGTLETAAVSGQLALRDASRVTLEGARITLDDTTATGQVGADLTGSKPFVTANLQAGAVDVTPFMAGGNEDGAPGGAGGGTAGGGGSGWSKEPLDLSALSAVDADIAVKASAVKLDRIELGESDIAAKLRNGQLALNINRVITYGGAVTGSVSLGSGGTADLTTDLTIEAVQLRPLLAAMAGVDNLEGTGAFRLKLDGQGRSLHDLMNSLDGSGALELTDGAILGINLAQVVRNLTGGGGASERTDFSSVTGSFDITDGLLHNTDFAFLGPLLRIVGAGTVDLGGQTQNFKLTPKAVASLTGQGGVLDQSGLSVFPVLITGTWANPQFRPDLSGAIQGLIADPGQALSTVTGVAEGLKSGGAAGALVGALTGSGGTASSGGTDTQDSGTTNRSTAEQAIGGLLGALTGGGSGDAPAPSGSGADSGTGGEVSIEGGTGALGSGGSGPPASSPAPVPAPPADQRRAIADEATISPEAAAKDAATTDEGTTAPSSAPPSQPQSTEEKAIRAIDNLLKGFGN